MMVCVHLKRHAIVMTVRLHPAIIMVFATNVKNALVMIANADHHATKMVNVKQASPVGLVAPTVLSLVQPTAYAKHVKIALVLIAHLHHNHNHQ